MSENERHECLQVNYLNNCRCTVLLKRTVFFTLSMSISSPSFSSSSGHSSRTGTEDAFWDNLLTEKKHHNCPIKPNYVNIGDLLIDLGS